MEPFLQAMMKAFLKNFSKHELPYLDPYIVAEEKLLLISYNSGDLLAFSFAYRWSLFVLLQIWQYSTNAWHNDVGIDDCLDAERQ